MHIAVTLYNSNTYIIAFNSPLQPRFAITHSLALLAPYFNTTCMFLLSNLDDAKTPRSAAVPVTAAARWTTPPATRDVLAAAIWNEWERKAELWPGRKVERQKMPGTGVL